MIHVHFSKRDKGCDVSAVCLTVVTSTSRYRGTCKYYNVRSFWGKKVAENQLRFLQSSAVLLLCLRRQGQRGRGLAGHIGDLS